MVSVSFNISFAGMETNPDLQTVRELLDRYSKLSINSEMQKFVFPEQLALCLNAMRQLHPQLKAKLEPTDYETMELFKKAMAHLEKLQSTFQR